jgi:hypothetical protein
MLKQNGAKRNCVKWDVSVNITINCAILSYAAMEHKQQTTTTTTTTTFIPVHTTLVYVGSRDIVPLILNLGCRWRCRVRIKSRKLYPFESIPVPIKHEAECPRARLDAIEKKKIFSHCQDSHSRSTSPGPDHSSNYTILAQYCKLSKLLLPTNCMNQGPQEARSLSAIQEGASPLCNIYMFCHN